MLRNRYFWILWFVNITATLAIELLTVTILLTIYEETASTLQAAGTMVARTMPAFLLGPIAGVLVDRFPRKYMLISMGLIQLVLVVIVFWFLQGNDQLSVITIYLVLAALAAADVFHRPARLSLIPSLVTHEQLIKANSFIVASNQIMVAVSYTVGSWLILTVPLQHIALGVAALFAMAVIAAIFIVEPKFQQVKDIADRESFVKSLVSGWNYLRYHPIARSLTVMETIEHLPHGIWTGALILAFTTQALHGDVLGWGYQVTSYFTGMILGSFAALIINDLLRRYTGRIIVVNACMTGLLTLAYATSQTVWIAVVWAFIFGPPSAIRDVAQDSLLQGTVKGEQLGRVYATREMLRNAVFMFAAIFFAWLSYFVSIRMIYVIGGIIYMLTALYALSSKPLRDSKMPVTAGMNN